MLQWANFMKSDRKCILTSLGYPIPKVALGISMAEYKYIIPKFEKINKFKDLKPSIGYIVS